MTEQVFQENWKAISPAYYFCQRIASHNDTNGGMPSQFHSEIIRQIFKPYTEGEYRPYLEALKKVGILQIDETYTNPNFPVNYNYNNNTISTDSTVSTESTESTLQYVGYKLDNQAKCKSYLITEIGLDLLLTGELEYLKKLHNDKKVKRLNQKRISERKAMKITYGNFVLDYIYDCHCHMSYDYEKAMNIISGSNWEAGTMNSAANSLVTFTTKDFTPLKVNETDGRVFNDFVAMKSDLRNVFAYKQMTRKAILDIRACHPTYFSSYLLDIATLQNNPNLEKIKEEHGKWVELFTNPNIDPREVIGLDLGKEKSAVKEELNKALNGHKAYKKILGWIEQHFPSLYTLWQTTDTSKTGVNISRLYESKVMLNPKLYQWTEERHLKIAYEYDGISVFSADDGQSLVSKVDLLAKMIQCISLVECGVNVVLKVSFSSTKSN